MRASPPTRRVAALLAAVVADPSRAASLAELARRTGISKATALGILNELADTGWLSRDPDAKTYRPGPAMLAAGAAAQAGFASVQIARPHMARLAAQTGAPCTASAVVDDQVTVLARVDAGPGSTPAFRVGQRYPFAPPAGVMFAAWDGEAAVESWLRKDPLPPLHADADELRAVAAGCRRRGYLVVGLGEVNAGLYALLAEVGDDELAGRLGELLSQAVPAGVQPYLDEPQPGHTYDVSLVCAPVFDPAERMDFLLAVLLMRSRVPAEELRAHIDALTATTQAVAAQLSGRRPG